MKIFDFTYIYTKWILLALMIIAATLRIIGANTIPLNLEEQLLWFVGTQKSILEVFEAILQFQPNTPIIAFTTWMTNFKNIQNETLSRLPSLISGIVAIPLIFILARKFYSEIEGLIAASFVTFNWICINNSQTLNEYSILFSATLLYFISLMTFLDRISEENVVEKSDSVLLIFSGIVLGFTSICGILTILVTFFYSFFFIKKIDTFFRTVAHFITILLPLAIYLLFLSYISENLYTTTFEAIYFFEGLNFIIANNLFFTVLICSPLLFLAFIYIKRLIKPSDFGEDSKTKFSNSTLILTIWLFGSIILLLVLAIFLKFDFKFNDLIIFLPPIIILIARSLVLTTTKLNNKIILGSILSLVIIITYILNFKNLYINPEYERVSRYIKFQTPENPKYGIIFAGNAGGKNYQIPVEASNFYLKKNDIHFPTFTFGSQEENISAVLKKIKKENITYVWIICDTTVIDSKFIRALKKNINLVDGFRYKKIILFKATV